MSSSSRSTRAATRSASAELRGDVPVFPLWDETRWQWPYRADDRFRGKVLDYRARGPQSTFVLSQQS